LESSFGSLNTVFLAKSAAVLPDHAHFLATQTRVLDRHAEELVLVLLAVGGKGTLVGATPVPCHQSTLFAKSGSFFLIAAIRLDSRCMRWSFVIVL